jgi:3,4-dihydroxy 2-butanone 4-phosphate synthase/GTP cyclohydrolase II
MGDQSLSEFPAAPARVRQEAKTVLPTEFARFEMRLFVDTETGDEHVALILGDIGADSDGADQAPPLVRLHSECLTGDALGSHRCDCGDQLRAAQRAVAAEGRGIILYLGGHEGRGIGLTAKLRAYELQDGGADTVDANHLLGFPADARSYAAAAAILIELNAPRLRLLSSNSAKFNALTSLGLDVESRIPLIVAEYPENTGYLETKRERMGHDSPLAADYVWSELVQGRVSAANGLSATAAELLERYGPLVSSPALVLAQLGQSADGFIAARTGDAAFVTGEQDREHLHRVRALVDAVVVGVGTLIADDCQLTVRAVQGPNPVRVILDPTGRAPRGAAVFRDGAAPTLWFTGPEVSPAAGLAEHVEPVRLPLSGPSAASFAPEDVLECLAGRGLGRILVEGGGRTVSRFLAADVLDRLFLTIAPLLVGDGVPGLRFGGTDRLADALRAPARRFLFGEDTCLEFDLAAARRAGALVAGTAER